MFIHQAWGQFLEAKYKVSPFIDPAWRMWPTFCSCEILHKARLLLLLLLCCCVSLVSFPCVYWTNIVGRTGCDCIGDFSGALWAGSISPVVSCAALRCTQNSTALFSYDFLYFTCTKSKVFPSKRWRCTLKDRLVTFCRTRHLNFVVYLSFKIALS